MKKEIIFCLIAIMMLSAVTVLNADVNFYGSARLKYWYEHTDKDWNSGTNESNLALDYGMQGNSRLGADFDTKGVTGKVELGLSPSDVKLRLLYGKITNGDMSITIGQDYSGFKAYSEQVYDDDLNFIYYGLFYDGPLPMVKLTFNDRFNVMFITPKEVDNEGLGGLQSLIPKINLSYEYTDPDFYFSASAGFNMNQYNEDYSTGGVDEMILAYVVSLTGRYDFDEMNLLAQLSYGVNVENYGIYTITPSAIVYDAYKNSFEDSQTLGGLVMVGSEFLTAGFSYIQTSNSFWDEDDTAMSAFIQKQVPIYKNILLVPEVGMFDDMKDGFGNNEGMKIYGGMKIQIDM